METRLKKIYHYIPAILTSIFAIFCIIKFLFQGPFFIQHNGDVNYVYLLSGIDYLKFEPAAINDQPGVTCKLWNALIIGIIYFFRSLFLDVAPIAEDVIRHSELYLSCITFSLFAIASLMIYKLLLLARDTIQSNGLYLLGATSLFFSSAIFIPVFINKPDIYLLIGSMWFSTILLRIIFTPGHISVFEISACIVFAILSKITFLPFVMLLLCIRISANKLIHTGIILISSYILALLIWGSSMEEFINWTFSLASKTGAYGSGASGFIDMNSLGGKLLTIAKSHGLLLLSIIVLTYASFTKHASKRQRWMVLPYVVFLLFILKHPSKHYFLPCYAMLPFLFWTSPLKLKAKKWTWVIGIFTFIFFIGRGYSYTRIIQQQSNVCDSLIPPRGIQTYYSPSKEYNLFFANKLDGFKYDKLLYSLYPNDTFYSHQHDFYTFEGKIEYSAMLCKEMEVTGSSAFIERNKYLTILDKEVDRVKRQYKIRIRNVVPSKGHYFLKPCSD